MKCTWQEGNRITLLENGDNYYPAVFEAISHAQQKVFLETFIWFEDDVGRQLHSALLHAARRGIKIEVLLDGYGSPDLSDEFVNELTAARGGVPLLRSRPASVRHAHQPVPPYAPQNCGGG